MNTLLWILQAALAFLFLSGGAYKTFKFEELAKQLRALPHAAWRLLGLLEVAGGILLVVPALTGWMPGLTPIAAGVLAFETLVLAALYARQSLKVVAANPMVWAVVMGLLTAFVAYGRQTLAPLA